MGLFSTNSNRASVDAATSANNYVTQGGSGAEQDRYASHFSVGTEGFDRLKQAAMTKGEGAEQDRYQAHFGLDEDRVKAAARGLLAARAQGAEQERYASHFGLGADGWARAKALASMQGAGAEQDRYGSYFSLDSGSVRRAAESVREGAKGAANNFTR